MPWIACYSNMVCCFQLEEISLGDIPDSVLELRTMQPRCTQLRTPPHTAHTDSSPHSLSKARTLPHTVYAGCRLCGTSGCEPSERDSRLWPTNQPLLTAKHASQNARNSQPVK